MERVAIYYVEKNENDNLREKDLANIIAWCKDNNYNYTLYIDKVISRRNTYNRIKLDELKEDISNGSYSKIIIKNLSNICKDIRFNIKFIKFAEENNCEILTIDGFNVHQYKKIMFDLYEKIKEEKKYE